jgi:HAD superfamily hydrolase (TIGR01509 family)
MPAPAAPGLIIFDCDGVLVDSEPIATRVLQNVLGEAGLALSLEETEQRFMGRSRRATLDIVEREIGRALGDEFVAGWQARVFDGFRQALRPVAGIETALDRLTVPVCVASGSDPARIRLSLELTGLMPRFDGRIFSAADVPHSKPAPDLFLLAARTLGTGPANCVVVEDSLPGVQAAIAAGMPVYGYAARTPGALLAAAGAIVFDDMARLPDLLAEHSPGT